MRVCIKRNCLRTAQVINIRIREDNFLGIGMRQQPQQPPSPERDDTGTLYAPYPSINEFWRLSTAEIYNKQLKSRFRLADTILFSSHTECTSNMQYVSDACVQMFPQLHLQHTDRGKGSSASQAKGVEHWTRLATQSKRMMCLAAHKSSNMHYTSPQHPCMPTIASSVSY